MRAIGLVLAFALATTALPAPALATGPPAGVVPAAADTTPWSWPVAAPRQVIRAFLGPPEPWQPGHRGVDIAARDGELRSPADGVVRFAGWVVDRGVLSIDHGGGVISSYEPVSAFVAEGETVERGQPLARIEAGHCDVPCVHVGVRVDGEYRSPLRWLGGATWPILLPTRPIAGG